MQCGRYKITARLPFFTPFQLTLWIGNFSKEWSRLGYGFGLLKKFSKHSMVSACWESPDIHILFPKSHRVEFMSDSNILHKSIMNGSGLSETQNVHTDSDSKTSNQLSHGLFEASATCPELPSYHFELPNKTSERSYVRLEIFEYGFHGLFPLA